MSKRLESDRIRELKEIKSFGIDAYPDKTPKKEPISEILKNFKKLAAAKKKISVAGRIMAFRDQGALIFADLADQSGNIQIILKKDNLKNYAFFKKAISRGDFIFASGRLIKTQRGELSLEAGDIKILAKAINPWPAEWYGLSDVEERFRKRYLDFVLNKEAKKAAIVRALIIKELREKLWKEGFLEVETPILQPLAGGALAQPFVTHHNALNQNFYLRIAPELYLKRLLVGGFEKIFEIGKVFRNEGIDAEHNPEFEMMELYAAYWNFEDLMKFSEKLLKKYLPGKWQKITYEEAFKKYSHVDFKKIKLEEADEIFKKEIRPKIIKPTFVYKYPKEISPLAKSYPKNPDWTERFQLIANGTEIINGFSELNDPLDQEERMKEQEKKYRAGDIEASRFDEDFIEALKYGMPPAAGLGLGIDRLVALVLKTKSVKEAISFPTLRNEK